MKSLHDKVTHWLREKAEEHGKSAELMRAAKASKPSWYKLMQGRDVRASTFMEWIENLGFKLVFPDEEQAEREVCFVNAMVVNAGETSPEMVPEDYLAVPLVSEAGAGPGITPGSAQESWFLVYRNEPSIRLRSNLIAVRIAKGSTSMEPTVCPGDIVLVDRNDRTVTHQGGIWLVMEPDGSGKVKRVKVDHIRDKNETRLTFYSDNVAQHPPEIYNLETDYDGDIDRAIVGRVVWAWSDLTKK